MATFIPRWSNQVIETNSSNTDSPPVTTIDVNKHSLKNQIDTEEIQSCLFDSIQSVIGLSFPSVEHMRSAIEFFGLFYLTVRPVMINTKRNMAFLSETIFQNTWNFDLTFQLRSVFFSRYVTTGKRKEQLIDLLVDALTPDLTDGTLIPIQYREQLGDKANTRLLLEKNDYLIPLYLISVYLDLDHFLQMRKHYLNETFKLNKPTNTEQGT